ncbi:unnamed protein product [Ectocarpus sp. 6 AP-2014]
MLLNLGGPLLASSHAALYASVPSYGRLSPGVESAARMNAITQQRLGSSSSSSSISSSSGSIRRRRHRPSSASSGPRLLHPSGSGPEGVPSSLFTFQPPRATPIERPTEVAPGASEGGHNGGSDDGAGQSAAAVITKAVASADEEALHVRLVEESDLPDVSALLAEVFEPNILIDPAELRSESSVERLEKANKYLKEMAYKKILRSIKSRCGKRLTRGDFALTSDALVLAVRDSRPNGSARATSAVPELGGDGAGDGGGGDAGDIVAVVELCLRQPDGWFPINGPFVPMTGWEPYMCNLAVAEKYRGNGYGKQLVRLCEGVAKKHWGYERMYLHVDAASPAATSLYSSMGYEIIEQFQPPSWVKKLLGLRDILYQVKHFNAKSTPA